MTHRTVLPIAGFLLLIASFGYATMILAMGWLFRWQVMLPMCFLGLLTGSVLIRLGPEHSRRAADNGLSCMMAGIGMIGFFFLADFSFRLSFFFGYLKYFAQVLWLIAGLILTVAGFVLSAVATAKGLFTQPPHKPGHCSVCGYNRTGLPKRRCPECGTPF